MAADDTEVISISKEDLVQALITWETASRNGETLSHAESLKNPVEQTAVAAADYLWPMLGGAEA